MEEHKEMIERRLVGSKAGWIISFVLFPYGPFVYLAKLKVVTMTFAVTSVIASAIIHPGMVSVLAKTNDEVWQHWLVLLMGIGLYLLGTIQYAAGQRKQIWSEQGQKNWKLAGWFFGCVILFAVLGQMLTFHFLETGVAQVP